MRNVTGVRQTVRLTGRYGAFALDFGVASIAPHRAWNAAALVSIAHPRLWSIDHPALYRATLTLSDKRHRRVGGFVTYSGIRSITVKRGRLMLNGRALNLRGAEFREQDLQLGGALDPAHLQRLVAWVRALGATVIRSDPLNPQIAEMADRDGILLWSDIPVTQQFSNLDPSRPLGPRVRSRCSSRTSWLTRTTPRYWCGTSPTSCRARRPRLRAPTSHAPPRSPTAWIPGASRRWRSVIGRGCRATPRTRRSM